MSVLAQPSFAGGEIAPSMYGRVDLQRYLIALRHCENFFVKAQGGVSTRPGTRYVATVEGGDPVRLIPFQFSPTQQYVLEFTDQQIRFVRDGGLIERATAPAAWDNLELYATLDYALYDTVIWRAIVANGGFQPDTNPAQWVAAGAQDTWALAGSYSPGDYTVHNGVVYLATLASVGQEPDPTGSAYWSPLATDPPYRVATPYTSDELSALQYTQSADVLTITHPAHPPMELRRTSDDVWALAVITFTPDIGAPTGLSVEGFNDPGAWSSATTYARGAYVTSGGDVYRSLQDGNLNHLTIDKDYWDATTDNGARRNLQYVVTAVNDAGQEGEASSPVTIRAVLDSDQHPVTVHWSAVTDAVSYNIYRASSGIFGFVGNADGLLFEDIDYAPIYTSSPPTWVNPFSAEYPACVEYFQQRLCFGRSNDHPERIWMSRSGDYHNFSASKPPQDDDTIQFDLVGRQVNEIRHLVPLDQLLVLSSGNEWRVTGGEDGVLTPSNIVPRGQGAYGAEPLKPLLVGHSVLYAQDRGSAVRDVRFSFADDGYIGDDLTIMAKHLFEQYTIADWAYAPVPFGLVWVVRDDGVLLGLTYLREQEVWAWHRHTTQGWVERVCCIVEGDEDVLYLVVRRTVEGAEVRFIERMASRFQPDGYVADAFCVDAGLTYDGFADQTLSLRILNADDVAAGDPINLSGTNVFAGRSIGDILTIRNAGNRLRLTLTAISTNHTATATCEKVVPGSPNPQPFTDFVFGDGVTSLSGLDHLEGCDVAVLADGAVVGGLTVADGAIELPASAVVVHVGLGYTADLETLSIAVDGTRERHKAIPKVTVEVEETRGLWVGESRDRMDEVKATDFEGAIYDDPLALVTGLLEVRCDASWNKRGRVVIQQRDPLPATILSIMPEVQIGGS